MKRIVLLVLTLILALSVLVACGGSEDGEKGGDKTITTTEFDAGNVSVSVPSGWKAFPVIDMWAEPAANDPNKIMVIKGGNSDADAFTKPYLNVLYYKDVEMMLTLDEMKEFYEDTEDVESFTAGGINWNGFIVKSTNAIVLVSDDQKFQVDISAETPNGNITLEDADVKIILESIKTSAATEDATEAQDENEAA